MNVGDNVNVGHLCRLDLSAQHQISNEIIYIPYVSKLNQIAVSAFSYQLLAGYLYSYACLQD